MNAISAKAELNCEHCGLSSGRSRFCCAGCTAAYDIINGLGLGGYYRQRILDPQARPLRPEASQARDFSSQLETDADGVHSLTLAVEGLACGACVWLIESVLAREPALVAGRVNMTTRRLRLAWRGDASRAAQLVSLVEGLGYRLVPFDPASLRASDGRAGRVLMRALAVAGFAAANVMLLSIGTWVGLDQNMGPATRALLHWVSALIALPCLCVAGMPFFSSAAGALRHGRMNMDVPISAGVMLTAGVSLAETLRGGLHTYFDSAVTLLFFLLIGRVLDHRARGLARQTAQQLLMLRDGDVTVLAGDGSMRRTRAESVAPGERVLVGMGERVGVDGVVEAGETSIDASLVTGESLPQAVGVGGSVFAGTVNLGAAITVLARATAGDTLLAACVRLIEAAEAARGRFVQMSERVARFYAPAVHMLALATFLVWWGVLGRPVMDSLLAAAAVLLVTCPCALALAVPAVQVIVTGRLFRQGILLKSGSALERLAGVDTVVFDKTGTLTEPVLLADVCTDRGAVALAAGMAARSRHPLCRALVAGAAWVKPALVSGSVTEHPGCGLSAVLLEGEVRLGSRAFCGLAPGEPIAPELWLTRPGCEPVRFSFQERLRPDALHTVSCLRKRGLRLVIASGDGEAAVERVADALGIDRWHASQNPVEKVALIEALRRSGRRVLMVGDGLNDGPCLAAADVCASPASASDIAQTVADVVLPRSSLLPLVTLHRSALRARSVMQQNVALSVGYNCLFVPLAAAGYVTPWLAALAMSSSSLLVIGNAFLARTEPVA